MSEVNKAITLQQAKTLYDDLRERQENIPSAENIVMVQDQQPTIPANKVWLTETPPAGVDVPTYQEFTGVIAPDYADLDFPVSAGEHCIHNGVLYTAVQNINASEAWTAAHWEAGSVSSKLTEISTAIQGKAEYKSSSKTGVDLDLSDPDGNVIGRFKNGAFFTERFASNPNIITVKKDGTGDFSVLRSAVESITDADPVKNPYEIHVYPGTWNTLEGYTDAEIRAADIGGGYTDQSMVGLKLTDGISMIGIGERSKIVLTAELSTVDYGIGVRKNISTLNLQGTCRIENLTIKGKAIRYCVHDDFGSLKHYQRIVRNCAFAGIGNSMSYDPAITYGAGIASPGMDALFEDCDFGLSWGMHTRASMTGDSTVVMKNCKGLKAGIGDSANEADTAQHLFIFDDCDFMAVVINRTAATTPHIFVDGVKNKNTMLFCQPADIPKLYNVLKTKLSSLPVGTVVNVTDGEITAASNGIMAVKATDAVSALGVIVAKDDIYDYIQKDGYLQGARLGLSGLSVGDFVTVDADMVLTDGGTVLNAVGVVKYTDSNDNSQIWLMGR